MLQRQRDAKAETDALRDLRSQLVDTLQPTQEVLAQAGIQATFDAATEVTYYSSDEDEQPLSTQEVQRRREVGKKVAQEMALLTVAPKVIAKGAAGVAKAVRRVKAAKGAGKGIYFCS